LDENDPEIRPVNFAVAAGAKGVVRHLAFNSARDAPTAAGDGATGGEFFKQVPMAVATLPRGKKLAGRPVCGGRRAQRG
jgi:hypothetical protein